MSNLINGKIPNQAIQTLKIVKDLFGSSIVGVYLFGSAVNGGLRINSDVDVLVVVNHSLLLNQIDILQLLNFQINLL
ncbi:streptomycin 3''-adenylyltransferase, partial [Staphylococcus aureus M1527]|uniref:nucleotidyltransferase domain-containing protein n=1 Tax=Staphylococcus aureus TaxID=1280 RepID=UPI0004453A69